MIVSYHLHRGDGTHRLRFLTPDALPPAGWGDLATFSFDGEPVTFRVSEVEVHHPTGELKITAWEVGLDVHRVTLLPHDAALLLDGCDTARLRILSAQDGVVVLEVTGMDAPRLEVV